MVWKGWFCLSGLEKMVLFGWFGKDGFVWVVWKSLVLLDTRDMFNSFDYLVKDCFILNFVEIGLSEYWENIRFFSFPKKSFALANIYIVDLFCCICQYLLQCRLFSSINTN